MEFPLVHWIESGAKHSARWRSENGALPPKRIQAVDDTINADAAYKLACEGCALLWRGDYHNARQLLQAIARRIDGKSRKPKKSAVPPSSALDALHRHRQLQAQRARVLGMLLIPFEHDYRIPLRRAPDVRQACSEAWGEPQDEQMQLCSLRELQGIVGAHEWRKNGVEIAALGARIHPHYGVFSPIRGEYIELVANTPLPAAATELAIDVGTGTGILAALLAHRGIKKVIATDNNPRALACARDNLERLGLHNRIDVVDCDLYPATRAGLIVCNPPWLPLKPSSALEQAVYDPDSRMLRGFLDGLAQHLAPGGEGWLILSDFAELLGLRRRDDLLAMIDAAQLKVAGRIDTKPVHPKAADADDPLHAARVKEVTSLWRLVTK